MNISDGSVVYVNTDYGYRVLLTRVDAFGIFPPVDRKDGKNYIELIVNGMRINATGFISRAEAEAKMVEIADAQEIYLAPK